MPPYTGPQNFARHAVRVSVPADLPMLRLDAVLFEQVLFNLLDNAAKYAPEASEIAIEAHISGTRLILEIADQGPGIPADDRERIFDSFYRVRKGDHVQAGTGLGLSIARGFVEAMGGTISARNRSDHDHNRSGAVFVISLPLPSGDAETETTQ